MKIEWTKELSVNDKRIDKEHQMYFDLLNHIHNENTQGASKEKITRLINEFVQFVRFHFMSEENVMIDTGYSGYKEQVRAHNYCLENIKTKMFAFGNDEVAVEDIVDFAVEWFLMHVSSHDKKLGAFLTARQTANV